MNSVHCKPNDFPMQPKQEIMPTGIMGFFQGTVKFHHIGLQFLTNPPKSLVLCALAAAITIQKS